MLPRQLHVRVGVRQRHVSRPHGSLSCLQPRSAGGEQPLRLLQGGPGTARCGVLIFWGCWVDGVLWEVG